MALGVIVGAVVSVVVVGGLPSSVTTLLVSVVTVAVNAAIEFCKVDI